MWTSRAGFTLIELIIALGILTMIGIFAGNLYLNYTANAKQLQAANTVYEEGRFLMEKIVREIRMNTIDYEEYFNQSTDPPGELGGNYCLYDQDFYTEGDDGVMGTRDDESLGRRNPDNGHVAPLAEMIQGNLYLINPEGDRRTYISLVDGNIEISKLVGQDFGQDHINALDSYNGLKTSHPSCVPDDGEGDGLIDTWQCDPDYPCNREIEIESPTVFGCLGYGDRIVNDPDDPDHSFVDFTPASIDIVDLKFILNPEDDPWKAYQVDEVQIQPYVTVQMTVAADPKQVTGINEASPPQVTLTSTITTRNVEEVVSSCLIR